MKISAKFLFSVTLLTSLSMVGMVGNDYKPEMKFVPKDDSICAFTVHPRTGAIYGLSLKTKSKLLVPPYAVKDLTEAQVQANNRRHALRYGVLSALSAGLAVGSLVAQRNGYNDPKIAQAQAALTTTSVVTGLSAISHLCQAYPKYTVCSVARSACKRASSASYSAWNTTYSAASSAGSLALNAASSAGSSVWNSLPAFPTWKKSSVVTTDSAVSSDADSVASEISVDPVASVHRANALKYGLLSALSFGTFAATLAAQRNGYNDPKIAQAQAALTTAGCVAGLSAADHLRQAYPEYTVCSVARSAGSSVWNSLPAFPTWKKTNTTPVAPVSSEDEEIIVPVAPVNSEDEELAASVANSGRKSLELDSALSDENTDDMPGLFNQDGSPHSA